MDDITTRVETEPTVKLEPVEFAPRFFTEIAPFEPIPIKREEQTVQEETSPFVGSSESSSHSGRSMPVSEVALVLQHHIQGLLGSLSEYASKTGVAIGERVSQPWPIEQTAEINQSPRLIKQASINASLGPFWQKKENLMSVRLA